MSRPTEAAPTSSTHTLGVLLITLDEEANVERCLSSVAFADQIVVVDSFSKDRTVEIARSLGAEVVEHEWTGYSRQKEIALGRLTTEWVFWIDADEEVSADLREEISSAIAGGPARDGYLVPRMSRYEGRWIRHGTWYPDRKLRLARRSKARFDGRIVHESMTVEGDVGLLSHPLLHYPYRDRQHHLEKIELYARLGAEQMVAQGGHPGRLDLIVHPAGRFLRMYLLKRGFLDGWVGLRLAVLATRYTFRKHSYALKLSRGEGAGEADRA